MSVEPELSKDYRCNPSIVIQHCTPNKPPTHLMFDATKHFRESVVRWYPRKNLTGLDAIILTHDHADAMLGLDDVRGMQDPLDPKPIDIFLDQRTYNRVSMVFPYLLPQPAPVSHTSTQEDTESSKSEKKVVVKRWVAKLNFRIIEPFRPLQVNDLTVIPFPVKHGEDYDSLAFCIKGPGPGTMVYISDVSRIPEHSMRFLEGLAGLKPPASLEELAAPEGTGFTGAEEEPGAAVSPPAESGGGIDLLVVDALRPGDKPHPTHFSLGCALALVRHLRPKQTRLTGLGSGFVHELHNNELKVLKESEGIDVEMAFDGLHLSLNL